MLIKLATKLYNKIKKVLYGDRGLSYFIVHQSYHSKNHCDIFIYIYIYNQDISVE